MGFQPQPLSLQRERSTPRERIVKGRKLVTIENLRGSRMCRILSARTTPTLPDLPPRLFEHLFVRGVLPKNQFFDNCE